MAQENLQNRCLKCGGEMEEGTITDLINAVQAQVPVWVKGKAEPGTFSNLKLSFKKKLQVTTWRCTQCGFLESYAHPWRPRR
jgi:predicted nucleic-acid-binding Zn-ribbon protein